MAQSYNTAPPRIGAVAPGTKTGLVGKAMGNAPVKQSNRVSVRTHTRSKPGKGKSGD